MVKARSVYRPSQYRLSALEAVTRDNEWRRDWFSRFTTCVSAPYSCSTPDSGANTHVSLNPPPCDELTIIWPGTDEYRVKPEYHTCVFLPVTTKARKSHLRGDISPVFGSTTSISRN